MIGRSGERGSGISVLAARRDDDDDEVSAGYLNSTLKSLQIVKPKCRKLIRQPSQ